MGIRSAVNTSIAMAPPWPDQGGHFYRVKTGHFYCRSTAKTRAFFSFFVRGATAPRSLREGEKTVAFSLFWVRITLDSPSPLVPLRPGTPSFIDEAERN